MKLLVYDDAKSVAVGAVLCITLPSASRTACDVKFSEGIRLMKCFCRFFSYKWPVVLDIDNHIEQEAEPFQQYQRRRGRRFGGGR